jgi:hypothetical protein
MEGGGPSEMEMYRYERGLKKGRKNEKGNADWNKLEQKDCKYTYCRL